MNKVGAFLSWLQRYWLMSLSIILFLFSIVIAIYLGYQWFKVSRLDVTKNDLRKVSAIAKNDTGQYIQAEYPARLLYNVSASEIRVTRWTTSTLSTPLTITLSLAKGLVLSSTNSMPGFDSQLVFLSTRQKMQTLSVFVLNARTIEDDDLLTQSLRLRVGGFSPTLILPIEVEGAQRAIQRDFVSSTVNEKSPLIIALPALASLVAFGFNFIQQQYRERKEQAEKEREKTEKYERERKAQIQLNNVRDALVKANAAQARDEFEKLRESRENLLDFILTRDDLSPV